MNGWTVKLVDFLRNIAPWAPIPLFAESQRAQQALISAVTTRHSVSTCLTGCLRDFRRLWNIDYLELFGRGESSRPLSVTSLRHGNAFDLANGALLEAAGIVRLHDPLLGSSEAAQLFRETNVYLSFITPSDPNVAKRGARLWTVLLSLLLETAFALSMIAFLVRWDIIIATALVICVLLSQILVFVLRMLCDPIFGNQAAVHSDRALTSRNGAALDVHVIVDSWNSSRISVICGYSSQLHALSNIPIRTTRPFTVKWTSRAQAVVLTTQAALLAATTNSEGEERWSGLIWLSVYFLMFLSKKALHLFIGPEDLLEKQPASVEMTGPLRFSSRRSALVFISMLPVSGKVGRWAWWDVFMPDNDRRRSFQREMEKSTLFTRATRWQQDVLESSTGEKPESEISTLSYSVLQEASGVLNNDPCSAPLGRYLDVVYPKDGKPTITDTA